MGTGGEAIRTRFVVARKGVDIGTVFSQTSSDTSQAMLYLLPSMPAARCPGLLDHLEYALRALLFRSPPACCYGGKDLIQTSCNRCHGLCMEAEFMGRKRW
jgi:hypothetical protein